MGMDVNEHGMDVKASLYTYVLARNKTVTKSRCHLWVVNMSKITPWISCYVTPC